MKLRRLTGNFILILFIFITSTPFSARENLVLHTARRITGPPRNTSDKVAF